MARSSPGSSTTWTKRPSGGPPLCSWPVEWRYRGPRPWVTTQPVLPARSIERLELGLARRVDERLDADVVRRRGGLEELLEAWPFVAGRRLVAGEHLVRPVLRRLHVRLVERVDADDRPRDSGGELPAVELLPELVGIGDARLLALAVDAVRRLVHGNRNEALPLLPGRLRDQLLDPEPEATPADAAYLNLVAAVLPALAHPLAQLEPGVAVVEVASLHHLLDAEEQALEVHPDERRRDHPEGGERRVAAADGRLAGKDRAEAALAGERLELRARVGDRRERLGAAAGPVPEEVEVAARLERRARLGGDEEERARRVERVGRAADGRGMGRVQDLQVVALERAPEHLGREARPAHPEKDDRVELAHGAGGELLELCHALAHAKRLVEPAEPAVLVVAGPERGVASPEALDQLGGRERGQGSLRPGRARPTSRECPR